MDEVGGTQSDGGNAVAAEMDPEGFTITLDRFTGPLDLLLFLIKKNEMDIRDLAVAPIADQYASYIEQQKDLDLEMAGMYTAMAAELVQLKSRMILPRSALAGPDEPDPRKTLVDRLLLYRRFQTAGAHLKERAVEAAKRFFRGTVDLSAPYRKGVILLQEATLFTLLAEYRIILDASRGRRRPPDEIALDASRVEDRAREILRRLSEEKEISFDHVFFVGSRRVELLVFLLSLLELTRLRLIRVRQDAPFADIAVVPGDRFRSDTPPELLMSAEQIFETDEPVPQDIRPNTPTEVAQTHA